MSLKTFKEILLENIDHLKEAEASFINFAEPLGSQMDKFNDIENAEQAIHRAIELYCKGLDVPFLPIGKKGLISADDQDGLLKYIRNAIAISQRTHHVKNKEYLDKIEKYFCKYVKMNNVLYCEMSPEEKQARQQKAIYMDAEGNLWAKNHPELKKFLNQKVSERDEARKFFSSLN